MKYLFLFVFFLVVVPSFAHAYIDPGTGSYIIQLLIGILAGGLFAVKIFWGRIRDNTRAIILKVRRHDKTENK